MRNSTVRALAAPGMYALVAGLHGRRADTYGALLAEEGVEAVEADDVAAIIAQRGAPALIFVELVANDSLRVLAALHAAAPDTPSVVVSAFSSLRDMAWARRDTLGVAAVLPAEADPAQVRSAIVPLCRVPDAAPIRLFVPSERFRIPHELSPAAALERLAEELGEEFSVPMALVHVKMRGNDLFGTHGLTSSDVQLVRLVGQAPVIISDMRNDVIASVEPLVRAGLARGFAGAPLMVGNTRIGTVALLHRVALPIEEGTFAEVARHLAAELAPAVEDRWPQLEAEQMRREIAQLQARQDKDEFALRTLDKLVDHLDVGVLLFDASGRVRVANQALAALLGVDRAQLLAATRATLHGPEAMRRVRRVMRGQEELGEIALLSPRRVIQWHTRPVDLPDGPGQLDTFTDITAQVDLRVTQEHLALTDPLTDLANRRGGEATIRREMARARREGFPLAFAMFDIDHFKSVNDQWGHAKGDEVLRGVARTVQSQLRGSDLAVRWGGEEVLAVLPGVGLAGARIIAERVRTTLEAREFGEVGHITVSAGTSELQPGEDAAAALARADACLYEAKAAGRNCTR